MTMPERGTINVGFGQCHDLMVTQPDKPWIRYYSLEGENKVTLVWEKPLPEGVEYNSWMYTTPSHKLIMSRAGVMFMFDRNLSLLRQCSIPGEICGVMGDDYFLVCNAYTKVCRESDELRVSQRRIVDPEKDVLTLSVPVDGAYRRSDSLRAACTGDGHTVMVALEQSFVDFYSPSGK